MRPLLVCAAALVALVAPSGVQATTLEQACQTFAARLNAAKASGDQQKAQSIYTKGSQRIASRFNGATCPTVTAPTP